MSNALRVVSNWYPVALYFLLYDTGVFGSPEGVVDGVGWSVVVMVHFLLQGGYAPGDEIRARGRDGGADSPITGGVHM